MTTTHLFLSDGWIAAAQALKTEFSAEIPTAALSVLMNVIVTDIPHREGNLRGHIDSSAGHLIIDEGHLDNPDLTLTVDYDTAKAAFITRDQQALMQAFFGGKIIVDGDVSKLLALQSGAVDETAIEVYKRLAALTRPD